MSLTRRIAQSALLTAAGAASVIGAAAGSAQAVQLPATPDLGGVSNLDNLDAENAGEGLDSAARSVTSLAGEAGGEAVRQGVPAAGETVGTLGKAALPLAQDTTGTATGASGELLGKAATTVTDGGLPTESLTSAVPLGADSLTGGSLNGLPLG
ncbi:ATP-binding protein [Streptomyces sp. TRM 70351]|uniref:ATP-binding protein n=1 Tax=Streptomyces sp. TRM 70351 TaxID=3116552 RepID=UPI002E7C00EE|nr:ATP-binding protein [Streptomyces sp. TRM 70351]MEE1927731.1 ATP-binding protein [Streptomyces sp. TRM 70351]